MKTSFKAARGRVYHVVHETKTGSARRSCRTICGETFDDGERGTHAPTCPDCLSLDNPLELRPSEQLAFGEYAVPATVKTTVMPSGPMTMPAQRFQATPRVRELLEGRDLINAAGDLTRRGAILAEDFTSEPVPMEDVMGVVHRRRPLEGQPRCGNGGALRDAPRMTTSRYEKLRKIHEDSPILVTCVSCIAMP